jgi:hypothetical protein
MSRAPRFDVRYVRKLSARSSAGRKVAVVESRYSRNSRRTKRVLVALAGIALVSGCGSSSSTAKPTDNSTTTSAAGADSGSTSTTVQSGPGTTQSTGTGQGFSKPCDLVTVGDVQAVLPQAPAGEVKLATSSVALCSYTVDSDHRVTISLATGPAIEATKAAVAQLSDQTKVDGLGDVGYSSVKPTRLDVHFFKGNTEILMSGYGTTGGMDPLVALAKKVSAAL